jgi:hypothetical protein
MYRLQVSDRRDFSHTVIDEEIGVPAHGSATFGWDSPEGEYWWRLKARRRSATWSNWSEPINFWITMPWHQVQLREPEDGSVATTLRPRLSWHPVPDGDHYEVQWSKVRDFSGDSSSLSIRGFTWARPLSDLDNGDTYYWRVKEYGASWIDCRVWSFQVSVVPPEIPSLTQPRPGSRVTTTRPTFRWDPVRYAAHYSLELREDSLDGRLVFRLPRLFATSLVSPRILSSGRYVWMIRACSATGQATGAGTGWFEVVADRSTTTPEMRREGHPGIKKDALRPKRRLPDSGIEGPFPNR